MCSECRRCRKFVNHRAKKLTTLMGTISYHRPYYHGCACGGWVPLDETLATIGPLTAAAAEVVTLHGGMSSFDEAAVKTLPRSSGLRVSASTVQRVTEGVGDDLARRRQNGETFGQPQPWHWERDALGRTCAYVSLDATL